MLFSILLNKEFQLYDFHKSIHLTINAGQGGAWNLIWDGYIGNFTFGSYAIYRGLDSTTMTLLTQIQSNLSSYTDLNPPSDTVFYQIEVINPFGCYPDSIFTKVNTNYNSSRSNVANTMAIIPQDTTGIIEVNLSSMSINIYPNPNTGKFTIATNSETHKKISIQIFNTIGKIVYSEDNVEIAGSLKKQMDIGEMPNGIYYIRFVSEDFTRTKKIILQ